MVAHHSSFWGYHVHPKIRRGSLRARALNEGGVGTNWRFSTNKPPYLRNGARYDKGFYWSLIGNQKRAFYWYQNQRPWLTLKWPWTLCSPLHYTHVFTTDLVERLKTGHIEILSSRVDCRIGNLSHDCRRMSTHRPTQLNSTQRVQFSIFLTNPSWALVATDTMRRDASGSAVCIGFKPLQKTTHWWRN